MSNHKEITIDGEKVTSEEQFKQILKSEGLPAACTGGLGILCSRRCYRNFAEMPNGEKLTVCLPRTRVDIVLNAQEGKVVDLGAPGVTAASVGVAAVGIGYGLAALTRMVPRVPAGRLSSVGTGAVLLLAGSVGYTVKSFVKK